MIERLLFLIVLCLIGLIGVEWNNSKYLFPKINNYDSEDYVGLSGRIINFDFSTNKYILVVDFDRGSVRIPVYSKSRKIYRIDDFVEIVSYSDELYFIE